MNQPEKKLEIDSKKLVTTEVAPVMILDLLVGLAVDFGEGVASGDSVPFGDGEGEVFEPTLGDGEGVAFAVALAEGDGVGLPDGEGDGLTAYGSSTAGLTTTLESR